MGETVYGAAVTQLETFCRTLELGREGEDFVQLFADVVSVCDDRAVDLPPRWSGATDDCTPFELSIGIRQDGAPDVRVAFEAQANPPSAAAYWKAGARVNARLARRLGVDLSRFEALSDLFTPVPEALWTIWHGLELRADGTRAAKLYLNPLANGADRVEQTIDEAAQRLGLPTIRRFSRITVGTRTRPAHLSLDLTPSGSGRVKLYVRCWDASPEELESIFTLDGSGRPGDVTSFCVGVSGLSRLNRRPVLVGFHVSDPEKDRPARIALHVPTFPYAWNDAVMRDRTLTLLSEFGLPDDGYERTVSVLAAGALHRQRGLHSYLSFQREADGPRITVYFGGRLYRDRYGPLAMDPQRTWPSPVTS